MAVGVSNLVVKLMLDDAKFRESIERLVVAVNRACIAFNKLSITPPPTRVVRRAARRRATRQLRQARRA